MDILTAALEGMAANFENSAKVAEPDQATVERWRRLFHLADPYSTIVEHREAFDRLGVSDEHWELVQADKEAEGHDRETYEYSLTLQPQRSRQREHRHGNYLLKILPSCLAISSPDAVKNLCGMAVTPAVEKDGDEVFIRLNGAERAQVETRLAEQYPNVRPLFVHLSLPAPKALHSASKHPTLGADCTLPQHRLDDSASVVQQDEFPVWYFFYGTLVKEETLRRVLGTEETIRREKASVQNAKLTTWAGKYMGLVDGQEEVQGLAYSVANKEDEEKLRHYETDKYEVVRCGIQLGDGKVHQGLTFRFQENVS